jgi:hypothetical protein
MNVQTAVRQQLEFWHRILGQIVADCPSDVLNKSFPGAQITSIASIYCHAVIAEDAFVQERLRETPSIFEAQGWASRTGVSYPGMPPALSAEWAAAMKLQLPAFQEYAGTVFVATDAYLAALPDAEIARELKGQTGTYTVGFLLANIIATHVPQHAGEIAALKGVHGLKGLPF